MRREEDGEGWEDDQSLSESFLSLADICGEGLKVLSGRWRGIEKDRRQQDQETLEHEKLEESKTEKGRKGKKKAGLLLRHRHFRDTGPMDEQKRYPSRCVRLSCNF